MIVFEENNLNSLMVKVNDHLSLGNVVNRIEIDIDESKFLSHKATLNRNFNSKDIVNLDDFLILKGLSKKEFADLLGVSMQTVYRILAGDIPFSRERRYAIIIGKHFGMDIETVLDLMY